MNKKIVGILIVLAALFIAAPAFALTTGTLNLQGTVGNNVAIVVTTYAAAGTLDLNTTTTDLAIGSVNEKSNVVYTVTVASGNNGFLHDTVSLDNLAYTLSYNGGAYFTPTTGGVTITGPSAAAAVGAGVDKEVEIAFTADAGIDAGTYTDTLTFTISTP